MKPLKEKISITIDGDILEKLRAEVKILRAEKKRAEMEISFLKKLEEIERRRS